MTATLAELEREFEEFFIRGTESYVRAWLAMDAIRDDELWEGAILSDGGTAQTFESYLKDFIDRLTDRYPHLPIRRSTAFYNLAWCRRAKALGVPTEQVLQAPVTTMNQLTKLAEWDKKTGRVVKVDDTVVRIDALPGQGSPEERFEELVKDVVYSKPGDARVLVESVTKSYSDIFTYSVAVWQGRITAVVANHVRYIEGIAQSARYYDLLHATEDVPDILVKDFCTRLGTYPNERDLVEEALNGNI